MEKPDFFNKEFLEIPVIGIARNISFSDMSHILPAYLSAGLKAIEITMNTAEAAGMIRYAADHYGKSLRVGAGTVLNRDDLSRALEAGAGFIVTPVLDEQVIGICRQKQIPVFPGALTPTEICRAWSAGADMVKVFPCPGAAYIKDVLAPLDNIRLMPTGGIHYDNCTDFLKAGAAGLGMGSQLFDRYHIRNKDWIALENHFHRFTKKIRDFLGS
jgi:2-dehydro-3-deoxyphosphogluconate aldolase/(4S)-4-hydroxy-2-oxoglutarate aldolase